MPIKLETNLSTKLLIIVIPYLLAYPFFMFFLVMPVSDPITFWLAFFTIWFGAGLFGVLWAGNDDFRQGLVAIFWGLLILVVIISSKHSDFMYTLLMAHGGIFAGMTGAIFLHLTKRLIGRMRGLPPPITRPILPVERNGIIYATISYIMTIYLTLTWRSGLLKDLNSIWTWGGIILVGLWVLYCFMFLYKPFLIKKGLKFPFLN